MASTARAYDAQASMTTSTPAGDDVLRRFGWQDHLVFSVMLASSALIGVFFACHGGRQRTAAEFLVGDRKMGVFPIAMSLTASFTSGIMLLGIPLEIYRYGTEQYFILFGFLGATATITFLFMPVFYDLKLTSSYEYLERRFDQKIRILGSFLFFLSSLLYLPIVLYSPALVYNQVTGVSVSLITPIVSIVCIFYTTVLIDTGDQLLPLYVMHTAHHIFGLPGLFIAGVFSAALSSLSTVMNSTTCVVMRDLLESYFHIKFQSTWTVGIIARGLVIALGLVAIGGIYIVSKLGGILQVAYTISAVAAGSTFGVFTLGITCPFANTKGALAGGLAAVLLMLWCCIGSQMAAASGQLVEPPLPIAMDACPSVALTNSSQAMSHVQVNFIGTTQSDANSLPDKKDEVFALYRLSYMYLSSLGLVCVMVIGSLVSLCTGKTDESKLDENLFAPPVRRWLLRRRKARHEAEAAAKASKEEGNESDVNVLELTSLGGGVNRSNGGNPIPGERKHREDVELL